MQLERLEMHYTSARGGRSRGPGFNSVAWSDGLSEEQLNALERISSYATLPAGRGQPAPEIYSCYPLDKSLVALSRVIALAEGDYLQRGGNFWACHVLLRHDQLALIEYDIFSLLARADELFPPLPKLEGDLPLRLPAGQVTYHGPRLPSPPPELRREMLAALINALLDSDERKRVFLLLPRLDDALPTLALAWAAMPISKRTGLSWRSLVDDTKQVWLLSCLPAGYSNHQTPLNSFVVDLTRPHLDQVGGYAWQVAACLLDGDMHGAGKLRAQLDELGPAARARSYEELEALGRRMDELERNYEAQDFAMIASYARELAMSDNPGVSVQQRLARLLRVAPSDEQLVAHGRRLLDFEGLLRHQMLREAWSEAYAALLKRAAVLRDGSLQPLVALQAAANRTGRKPLQDAQRRVVELALPEMIVALQKTEKEGEAAQLLGAATVLIKALPLQYQASHLDQLLRAATPEAIKGQAGADLLAAWQTAAGPVDWPSLIANLREQGRWPALAAVLAHQLAGNARSPGLNDLVSANAAALFQAAPANVVTWAYAALRESTQSGYLRALLSASVALSRPTERHYRTDFAIDCDACPPGELQQLLLRVRAMQAPALYVIVLAALVTAQLQSGPEDRRSLLSQASQLLPGRAGQAGSDPLQTTLAREAGQLPFGGLLRLVSRVSARRDLHPKLDRLRQALDVFYPAVPSSGADDEIAFVKAALALIGDAGGAGAIRSAGRALACHLTNEQDEDYLELLVNCFTARTQSPPAPEVFMELAYLARDQNASDYCLLHYLLRLAGPESSLRDYVAFFVALERLPVFDRLCARAWDSIQQARPEIDRAALADQLARCWPEVGSMARFGSLIDLVKAGIGGGGRQSAAPE